MPISANAGLFAFVSGLFNGESKQGEVRSLNSQNIPLLQGALNIDPNAGLGGGDITIVGGTALLPEGSGGLDENTFDRPSSDQISIYVVREGDTLGTIAKMFGVSINTIRWGNDIKGSTISPGQTLTILPVSGVRHTIKKGDTLKSIAKLYDADLGDIKSYNNIDEQTALKIGDVVIVPDGVIQSSASQPQIKITSGNIAVTGGYFIRPATGPKTQGIHGYNGIDIGGPTGSPIIAAAAGTVMISKSGGWNGGYGNYVVIQHPNGTQTLYAHMSENAVVVGARVQQGQLIGYLGRTGKSTGPHLHFEVRGAKNPF